MPGDAYYRDKTADQILAELVDTAEVGSPVHEQQKMAIWLRLTSSLAGSLDNLSAATREATKETSRLQARIVALTIVLAVATAVGAIATLVIAARP